MKWCEDNSVCYVIGFARNERLRRLIEPRMQQAVQMHKQTGKPARAFTEFSYQTTTGSWSRSRPNAGISLCRRGRARPNLKLLRAGTGAPRAPCEISGLAFRGAAPELAPHRGRVSNPDLWVGNVSRLGSQIQWRSLIPRIPLAASSRCHLAGWAPGWKHLELAQNLLMIPNTVSSQLCPQSRLCRRCASAR